MAPFTRHNRWAVSFFALPSARAVRARLVAAAAAAGVGVVLLAGCGGSTATVYTASATQSCLEQAGLEIVPVDKATDIVADNALGGSLAAKVGPNHVTISFGRSEGEAGVIERAYAKYGSRDVPIDQVLQRKGNAVLLWAGAPTPQAAAAVRGCLQS